MVYSRRWYLIYAGGGEKDYLSADDGQLVIQAIGIRFVLAKAVYYENEKGDWERQYEVLFGHCEIGDCMLFAEKHYPEKYNPPGIDEWEGR